MLSPQQLPVGSIVSFNLYPTAVLGASVSNAKVVVPAMDSSIAVSLGVDIQAIHANVYDTLPASTPNDPTQYPWVGLLLSNGQRLFIGLPYIVDSTLVVASTSNITFTVENVTPDDQNDILQALAGIGFTAVNMKVATQS